MTRAYSPQDYAGYQEIKARILRLPIREEDMWRVSPLADLLALIGLGIDQQKGDGTAPPHFRSATAEMVLKELVSLERLADNLEKKLRANSDASAARKRLARQIQSLHEPTITALSDASSAVVDGQMVRIDWSYFRSGLPHDLTSDEKIAFTNMRLIADIANRAQRASAEVRTIGRSPDNRALAVANILARAYTNLTGHEQTFSTVVGTENEGQVYGPYLSLVTDIFKLLGIERDALSFASRAAFGLRGKGRKK
jgi:hypothetical protein